MKKQKITKLEKAFLKYFNGRYIDSISDADVLNIIRGNHTSKFYHSDVLFGVEQSFRYFSAGWNGSRR